MKATIKLGQNTKNHVNALRTLGYESTINGDGDIETEISGFVKALDLTNGPEALVEVIAAKQALTYGSKVTLFDEKTGENKAFSGVPMCLKLGALSKRMGLPNLSCLVMRGGESGSAKAPAAEVPTEWAAFAKLLKS